MPQLDDGVRAAVCVIWIEVLGVPKVHDQTDFFEEGGDSLQALIVAKRVRDLGLDAPNTGVLRLPVFGQYLQGLEQPELFDLE